MKNSKRFGSKVVVGALPFLIVMAFARATPDESPCAIITRDAKGSEMIPPKGRVQNKLTLEGPIACGSMLLTHEEPIWFKLSNQAVVKLAPNSFIEIPKENGQTFRIYRGEALISSPPGIAAQTWSTPNSETIFKGGVAWIQYSPKTRITTVSCFNREFEFRNKFNEDAKQVVHAGEMSKLAIQSAQVLPSQPIVMNQGAVKQALQNLNLPEADQTELVAVVKRVYEDRSKSLTSEIQDWADAPAGEPDREIASVKETPKKNSAIDPKEADFVTRKMRERLYGEESEEPVARRQSRKPASVKRDVDQEVIHDHEKQRELKSFNQEKKKLEKDLEQVNSD